MSSEESQTVAVTVEPSPAVLGSTVKAVITITGDPDRKVRGAKAQLVRNALHRYTETNLSGRGQHDSLRHEDAVITEVPVDSAGGKAAPGQYVVSLLIPEDGLPTVADQVRWSVRAVIDRRHGIDIQAEAPLEVLAGPGHFLSEATSEARYKGERCVHLELSARTMRAGQTITGNVILRPDRAITVTKVVVTFTLTFPVKKGLEGKAVAARILASEPLTLQPGDTRTIPFELTLPGDAAPTARGSMTTPKCHSIVSWDVGAEAEAVLAEDGKTRANGFAYLGINVYNADSPSHEDP
jgi:hypothetical protein